VIEKKLIPPVHWTPTESSNILLQDAVFRILWLWHDFSKTAKRHRFLEQLVGSLIILKLFLKFDNYHCALSVG
jgi:hypothetical protein